MNPLRNPEKLPYIGITDFTHASQAEALLPLFVEQNARFPRHLQRQRRLMVGVMMSYKTLHDIPTKDGWEHIWPKKEQLAGMFIDHPLAMNCIHYVDYDNMPELSDSLMHAWLYGGPNLRAIQLDMVWPDPDELRKFLDRAYPRPEIVLQVNKDALRMVEDDDLKLAWRLARYDGLIDYVLLDWSKGTGKAFDDSAFPFIMRLNRSRGYQLALGGGFGPGNLGFFESQLWSNPLLSIDAQGRLRPSRDAKDPIDWSLARTYIAEALAAVRFDN